MKKSNISQRRGETLEIVPFGFLFDAFCEEVPASIKEHIYRYVRDREILIPAHPPRAS